MTKCIAIFIPDLRGGGAERVFMNLAKYFVQQGFFVNFVLMQAKGELLSKVPEGAHVINLKASRIRKAFWPLFRYLRETKPDALLIGMWPLTVIGTLAHRLSRIPGTVVVSDHTHLSISPVAESWFNRLAIRLTMGFIYPLATARLAVSHGVADDLSRLSGLSRNRFKVIYNPVVEESAALLDLLDPWGRAPGKRILAVGNLKSEKNYECLIRAFALVRAKWSATLVILGEGDLRKDLEQLIAALGLGESIQLPGFVEDTAPWYRCANLFVLSSSCEGFGNVIVEALAAGTPVVSTDCPSGPREILKDGRYGRLVPVGDVEALADGILLSLSEPVNKADLQARSRDFSVDKIAGQYLEVLVPRKTD